MIVFGEELEEVELKLGGGSRVETFVVLVAVPVVLLVVRCTGSSRVYREVIGGYLPVVYKLGSGVEAGGVTGSATRPVCQ